MIVEFIEVINFFEVIEMIIETKLNVLIIWIREETLVICKRLCKSRKKSGYFYCFPNKHKIFHLFGLCLQTFMENLCTTSIVIAFMVKDIIVLKGIFSIFLLVGLVKLMVLFTDLVLNIKTSVFSTKILFFLLISWHNCFGVTY